MEKQKIIGISNRDDYICYNLEKKSSYNEFLFALLKEFNVDIPDLYDDNGKLPDILKEEDSHSDYEGNDIKIIEIIGHKSIFLIIFTDLRDKLNKFMERHSEFIKIRRKNDFS